ncbi:hypothetical protein D3C83_151410 [compost metagenome]
MELSPGWWWLREFRRHIAGEQPRLPHFGMEIPLAWTAVQALGIQLDFTALQNKE